MRVVLEIFEEAVCALSPPPTGTGADLEIGTRVGLEILEETVRTLALPPTGAKAAV